MDITPLSDVAIPRLIGEFVKKRRIVAKQNQIQLAEEDG